MVTVPEPSNNFKWLVLSEPTLRISDADDAKGEEKSIEGQKFDIST